MAKRIDSAKLGRLIREGTRETIANSESFIESLGGKEPGPETVSIMINGVETRLAREDYNALKEQNDAIKQKMKADIKALLHGE